MVVRLAMVFVALVAGVACDGSRSGDEVAAVRSSDTTVRSSGAAGPVGTSPGGLCVEVALDTPTRCAVQTHCGVRMFSSRVNGRWWVTDEGAGTLDYIPAAWGTYSEPPTAVTVVVSENPRPVLIAELNGHAVTYRPLPDEEFRGCA